MCDNGFHVLHLLNTDFRTVEFSFTKLNIHLGTAKLYFTWSSPSFTHFTMLKTSVLLLTKKCVKIVVQSKPIKCNNSYWYSSKFGFGSV